MICGKCSYTHQSPYSIDGSNADDSDECKLNSSVNVEHISPRVALTGGSPSGERNARVNELSSVENSYTSSIIDSTSISSSNSKRGECEDELSSVDKSSTAPEVTIEDGTSLGERGERNDNSSSIDGAKLDSNVDITNASPR